MKAIHRSMYLEYKERTRGVGRARSRKVAYAFAAAVTTIPVPAPRFPAASVFVGLAALTTAREFKSHMLMSDYRASSDLTFSEP
jgi:hypothetical protein